MAMVSRSVSAGRFRGGSSLETGVRGVWILKELAGLLMAQPGRPRSVRRFFGTHFPNARLVMIEASV
jgi:hypothetical protein